MTKDDRRLPQDRGSPRVPHSREAETAALGAAIISPKAAATLVEQTSHDDFFIPELRLVRQSIETLLKRGSAVDQVTVVAELERAGIEYPKPIVAELLDLGVMHWNLDSYITALQERTLKRTVFGVIPQLETYATNGKGLDFLAGTIAYLQELQRGAQAPEIKLDALDLRTELARDPEVIAFVWAPHIPAQRRVWAFGAAESGKSMWATWVACNVSRAGRDVLYVSQENPLDEDLRRLRRLRPDPEHLHFIHNAGLDLALPSHVSAVIEAAISGEDPALIVFDTISASWTGDENDNAAIASLDRDALALIVRETGATVLVLDHTGHPQAFVRRDGASAGRGASAKGQKADVVLNFKAQKPGEFTLAVGKMRAGNAARPPDAFLRVVDTVDGGIDIETVGNAVDVKVAEIADAMVEAITGADSLTTNALRKRVKTLGGKDAATAAMRLLEVEQPPRVRVIEEVVDTGRGRQRAKVWRLSEKAQL